MDHFGVLKKEIEKLKKDLEKAGKTLESSEDLEKDLSKKPKNKTKN